MEIKTLEQYAVKKIDELENSVTSLTELLANQRIKTNTLDEEWSAKYNKLKEEYDFLYNLIGNEVVERDDYCSVYFSIWKTDEHYKKFYDLFKEKFDSVESEQGETV